MTKIIDINNQFNEGKDKKYEYIKWIICWELLDLMRKSKINDVVIWVSWWIDSAVDLCIASEVLINWNYNWYLCEKYKKVNPYSNNCNFF